MSFPRSSMMGQDSVQHHNAIILGFLFQHKRSFNARIDSKGACFFVCLNVVLPKGRKVVIPSLGILPHVWG